MAGTRHARKEQAAPSAADELRRQAEERLDRLSAAASPVPEDIAAVVHELRVHQIELEMQNEEMRRAQLELQASREKYIELFDLAPVGYLTLSDKSVVGDANFTAARLLGVERRQLVGRPLAGEQPPTGYEIDLVRKDGTPFTAEVSAGVITYEGAPADLVLMRDITERKQAEERLAAAAGQWRQT